MTLPALPNAAATVTDSIFTWTFRATTGDSWGGVLVDDSTRYVVGSTLTTAHGTYTIVAVDPQGTDLGAFGMEEGWISVGWYRDSSGVWMVTRLGESTAAGLGGLGTEVDAAWTGTAWDSFGLGGADQANPGDLADSLFTWSFTFNSGDVLFGTLLADSVTWAPGDTFRTAHGVYRILTELPVGQSGAQPGSEGTVHTTRYYDAAARTDFTLESGGAAPTGFGGLGSELDRAWTGTAWVQVGQGGTLQADRTPEALFNWTFQMPDGDRYFGQMAGHSTAWNVGDTAVRPSGTYTITAEAPLGGWQAADGTVWTTGGYFDASANQFLTSYSSYVLGGAPSGYGGLGTEFDYVWDGDEWDDFGLAGTLKASVEQPARFAYYFQHGTSGDLYVGFVVADAGYYTVGQEFAGARGTYTIYDRSWDTSGQPEGAVWITDYLDAQSQLWFRGRTWEMTGKPVTAAGLGQEFDYAWDGTEWDDFGEGGIQELDVGHDNFHVATSLALIVSDSMTILGL